MALGITTLVPCAVATQYLRVHPNRLLACYLGWVVPLLGLTMARKEANPNYVIELLLALRPLFAGQLTRSLARPSSGVFWQFLLAVTHWLGNVFRVWVPHE